MALTLRIENSDATTTFDLTAVVKRGSHQQQRAGNKVIETWSLLKKGTAAQVRTAVNSLIDLLEQAVEWHDNTTKDDSVWLREATDGETAKRALVYNYELQPVDAGSKSPYLINPGTEWQLAITRAAEWEPTTASFTAGDTGIALSLSGGILPTGATSTYQGGTKNGRISKLTILPTYLGVAGLERCWVGIRPTGEITDPFSHEFDPVIALEDIATGTADNDIYTDGSIDVVRTRFSDAGGVDALSRRWVISINDTPTTDPTHYIGSYLVLMRYQVTVSGTEIGVRLSTGYSTALTGAPTSVNDIQYLEYTGGAYRLAPLGTAVIVGQRTPDSVTFYPGYFTFHLDAGRFAGTGHLYSHRLILIPSPHSIFVDNIGLGAYATGVAYAYTSEAEKLAGYSLQSLAGPGLNTLSLSPDEWEWPTDGGFIVVAGERAASHVLTDTLNTLQMSVYKRWKGYHG